MITDPSQSTGQAQATSNPAAAPAAQAAADTEDEE